MDYYPSYTQLIVITIVLLISTFFRRPNIDEIKWAKTTGRIDT